MLHWSLTPSNVLSVISQSISELVLHNDFLLSFEVLSEQKIDSIFYQLAGRFMKIMVSARKPQRQPSSNLLCNQGVKGTTQLSDASCFLFLWLGIFQNLVFSVIPAMLPSDIGLVGHFPSVLCEWRKNESQTNRTRAAGNRGFLRPQGNYRWVPLNTNTLNLKAHLMRSALLLISAMLICMFNSKFS